MGAKTVGLLVVSAIWLTGCCRLFPNAPWCDPEEFRCEAIAYGDEKKPISFCEEMEHTSAVDCIHTKVGEKEQIMAVFGEEIGSETAETIIMGKAAQANIKIFALLCKGVKGPTCRVVVQTEKDAEDLCDELAHSPMETCESGAVAEWSLIATFPAAVSKSDASSLMRGKAEQVDMPVQSTCL